jgi:alpha-mannosidase
MLCRTARWGALALLALLPLSGAVAGEIWRIGANDNSYDEFAIARDYPRYAAAFPQDVTYEIGRSNAKTDWPFIQPGPADAWAGSREHPFRIRFDLPSVPTAPLELAIDLVSVQSPNSATLVLTVNGTSGEYQLTPGAGDATLGDPSLGREQLVTAYLDPAILRAGANEIVITVRGSWILYDAISLATSAAGTTGASVESLQLEQTQLLKRQPGGRLANVVTATVRATGAEPITLEQHVEGAPAAEVPAVGGVRFGDLRVELLVPEVTAPRKLTVVARTGPARAEAEMTLQPVRHWRIYVAAASHTDIGYTDLQENCIERHCENADVALKLCREFPGFGWNLETSWQADEYLRRRGRSSQAELFRLANEGRLGIQANYLNMLTGLCSHEGLNRWLSFAHKLHVEHGVPFESAVTTDVPTQVWSIPTTLAAAGIRYYATGINNDRAYPFRNQMVGYPYWWEGPDGSRVLAYFAPGYAHGVGPLGSRGAFEGWLRQALAGKESFPYDALFLYGLVSDNQPVAQETARVATEWNEAYAFPRLYVGPYAEYMRYMDETYGDRLPVLRGDPGVYWEDGAASSAAETTLNRNAHEIASAGEALHGLAAQTAPDRADPATGEFAEMWRNVLLYDEHTWGAYNSISQPDLQFVKDQWAVKASFAEEADRRSRELLGSGLASLVDLVPTKGPSLVLYNATSWPREGGIVEERIPTGTVPTDPATGKVLPTVEIAETRAGTDVVFRAPTIPPWGYVVCPLVEGRGAEPVREELDATKEARLGPFTLRFATDTGAVASLRDAAGRELVDASSGYGLNEYLYVSGGDDSDIISARGRKATLTINRASGPSFERVVMPGLGESLVVHGSAPNTPSLQAAYTVWDGSNVLQVANQLERTEERKKEAVYFAFPFRTTQPEVRTEIPNGVVRCGPDQLKGGCTEWFATEHWVRVAGAEGSVAWTSADAPLFCVDDINRGLWPEGLEVRKGWLFSYAMNNYWHTNYKASQDGYFRFRFAVTTSGVATDAGAARFGWQESMPIWARLQTEEHEGALPAGSASLCRVVSDRAVITAVKPAEEGGGLVVRLFSYGTKPVDAVLDLGAIPFTTATRCTLMEDPLERLEVSGSRVLVPGVVPLRPVTVLLR